jgi:hypothetical protein
MSSFDKAANSATNLVRQVDGHGGLHEHVETDNNISYYDIKTL